MTHITLQNIILFFTFFVNLILCLYIFFRPIPQTRIKFSFSILLGALALWNISVLMIYLFKDYEWKLFWVRMSFLATSVAPFAFLLFSLFFPRDRFELSNRKIFLISIPSIFLILASFSNWMVQSVEWDVLKANYGPLHPFFGFFVVINLLGGLFFLLRSYINSIGLERLQIKYCLWGMFISSFLATTLNLILPSLGTSKLSHLGPSSTIIMVIFITYAILKHRLMDINIVFKKGTTFVLLLLLLFVPSFILILLGQKIFYGKVEYLFTLMIFSILILVAFLFHRIKPSTEKAVEQFLFKDRYNYRDTLGKFSKAMVNILDLQSLSRRIIETMTQTLGVDKASLFLLNDERGGFEMFESKNINSFSSSPLLSKEAPLSAYLQKMKEIIVKEELAKGIKIPDLKRVAEQMDQLQAEVSIPLISKGKLIGFINLSHKFNRDMYYQEDIDLLTTLANQTTIAIENARLYEDLKKSKSYVRRADRLASLGTLTAGLAHEIRNPLVAIKTLTQLLPERLEDEEFRNHFLSIASGEVERISHLINELLDFARPSNPKLEFEDINSILDGMILLVSTESKKKHIQIQKQYLPDLPPVKVDREQIKQVFLNILLNAIDATPENGTITVKTRSFTKPGGELFLQVEFKDTGCGIPQEHLEEIFNPFFTTKTSGSGLGLSISNQIVQDHKGYISVESQVNRGTSFFVNLPVDQDHPKRRRSDFESQQTFFEPR